MVSDRRHQMSMRFEVVGLPRSLPGRLADSLRVDLHS
jgi:hypothetical protein